MPDANILGLSDDMMAAVDEQIKGISSQRSRFEELLDLFRGRDLFDRASEEQKTKTAMEAFRSGTANCLSHSFAFASMARYAGLEALFQEIAIPPEWDRDGELIYFSRHVNVAVKIGNRIEYEIDFYPQRRFLSQETEKRLISDARAKAQFYNNIASEHLRDGNMGDAFRYCVKAIKVAPTLDFAWSNLGSIYNLNGQFAAAEKAYKRAVRINSRQFTAMSNLTRLYDIQGRDKEASYYRKRVRAHRNKNPYYHFAQGERAYGLAEYADAVGHFKRAIWRQTGTYQFYYELARAYHSLGNLSAAERSMEKVRKYAPDTSVLERYDQKWEAFVGRSQ